jgi:hypothetical protein
MPGLVCSVIRSVSYRCRLNRAVRGKLCTPADTRSHNAACVIPPGTRLWTSDWNSKRYNLRTPSCFRTVTCEGNICNYRIVDIWMECATEGQLASTQSVVSNEPKRIHKNLWNFRTKITSLCSIYWENHWQFFEVNNVLSVEVSTAVILKMAALCFTEALVCLMVWCGRNVCRIPSVVSWGVECHATGIAWWELWPG